MTRFDFPQTLEVKEGEKIDFLSFAGDNAVIQLQTRINQLATLNKGVRVAAIMFSEKKASAIVVYTKPPKE